MGIVGILVAVAVIVGAVFLYIWIVNRGKKCKECEEKYDSSCLLNAKVIRTVKGAMGMDFSDVECLMKCKKCGKESVVKVTVKAFQQEDYIDRALKHHFDK